MLPYSLCMLFSVLFERGRPLRSCVCVSGWMRATACSWGHFAQLVAPARMLLVAQDQCPQHKKPALVSLSAVLNPSPTAPLAFRIACFSSPPPHALCPHPHRASTSTLPYPASSFKKMARSKRPATPVGGGRSLSQRRRVAPEPPAAGRGIASSDVARNHKEEMRLTAAVGRAAAAAASAAAPLGAVEGRKSPRFALPLEGAAAAGGPSGLAGVGGGGPPCAAGAGDAGQSVSAAAGVAGGSSAGSTGSRVPARATRSRAKGKGKQALTSACAMAPPAAPVMPSFEVLPMMEDTASLAAATASTLSTEVGGSSGSSAVPPVVRGASEAIRLRDGGMVPVALPVPSGAPPCHDRFVAALSTAPPPSLDEEPPLSSSAGTAAAAVPCALGGTARAAPLAGAVAAVPGDSGGTEGLRLWLTWRRLRKRRRPWRRRPLRAPTRV